MSEMGEDFAAWRVVKQAKKASNRANSPEILRAAGIAFTTHNDGAHLIVSAPLGHLVDFWPGTGKWQTRGYRFALTGRGVHNLIQHLKDSK